VSEWTTSRAAGSDSRPASRSVTRRQAILGSTAAVAAAGLPLGLDPDQRQAAPNALTGPVPAGLVANDGVRHGHRVLSALFFGGPPNPVTRDHFYSRHPLDADRLDWTDRQDIDFAVDQFVSAGLNTMKLSYFGHRGETDDFAPALLFSRRHWDGSGGTYTEPEQVALAVELFEAARRRDVLVAPMLEVSPAFQFWKDFPRPDSGLVERAVWLLTHFGTRPNYLKLADRDGRARHVIWLIESIHGVRDVPPYEHRLPPLHPEGFAAGFDDAANLIKQQTGYDVGFVPDTTPLPGYGSHYGPDPAFLRNTRSVVAVNPFNIASQDTGARKPQREIAEQGRLAYARTIMTRWSSSGIPFLAPVLPYFNDTRLSFRPDTVEYGGSNAWLDAQRSLALEFATHGLSVDTWNGYSEGYCIPPTVEDGQRFMLWLRSITLHLNHLWRQ